MSTLSEREEALRRALFSAAESIEPAPDGLERIRARLTPPRPPLIAWLEGIWTGLVARARALAEDSRRLLASGFGFAWHRFAPAHAAPGQRNLLRWFRPMTAMAVATFVVAVGVYVGLNESSSIFPTNTSSGGQYSPGSHHSGNGTRSTTTNSSQPASSSGSPVGSVTPSSSASCASSTTTLPPLSPGTSESVAPTTGTPSSGSSSDTPTPPATSTPADSTSPAVDGSQVPSGSGSDAASAGNTSTVVTTAASRCSKHKKSSGHTLTDAQAPAGPGAAAFTALAASDARLNAIAS
jgi:hypothetical protein